MAFCPLAAPDSGRLSVGQDSNQSLATLLALKEFISV